MSEQVYGVCFDDGGATYLVALFDAQSEAESYMERLEEERFEAESEADDDTGPDAYEVVEFEPEMFDDDALDRLELGFAVRIY